MVEELYGVLPGDDLSVRELFVSCLSFELPGLIVKVGCFPNLMLTCIGEQRKGGKGREKSRLVRTWYGA